MWRASLFLLVCFTLFVLPLSAQDEPASPTPTPLLNEQELIALATQVAENTQRAEVAAAGADASLDRSFDLLNLFEVFGAVFTLLIPAIALAAGFFGFRRLQQLDSKLQEAVQNFDEMQATSKRMIDTKIAAEEISRRVALELQKVEVNIREIQALRHEIRREGSNSVLALSFLPLGERQYRVGDFKGAEQLYKRALELDYDNPITHYRLGYVYTQIGQLEEAEAHLKKSLEIEKDFPPALAVLGYTYRRIAERMDEDLERDMLQNQAEQLLQRALALSPRLVDDDGESWWGSLGGLYRRRGQIEQATRAYMQAGYVTPNSSYAFSNLALLYMQQGNRDRMIETYDKVEQLAQSEVQADPDNYWANADLLTSRLALGKITDAEMALRLVLRTAPTDSRWALESLIDTLERLASVLPPDLTKVVQEIIEQLRRFLQSRYGDETES